MGLKVLVTGFEPFLEFKTNPTQKIVNLLDKQEHNGINYVGKVLLVDYSKIEDTLKGYINESKPDLIIGTGLAAGRSRISIEKIAINYKYSTQPDNAGKKESGEKIDPKIADGLFSMFDVEGLYEKLNSLFIPTEISLTAGAYLCNYSMFIIIRESMRRGIRGGFIHFPADTELSSKMPNLFLPSMTIEMMIRAIEIIAEHESFR